MNEVKRYHEFKNGVVENEHGMFVTHEDYAALQQQLTATTNSLTNAQEALKSAGIEADTVQAGVMELKTRLEALAVENDLIHSNPSLASMMDALDKFYEHEHLPETGMLAAYKTLLPKRSPATDAYLNAVRADAVTSLWRKSLRDVGRVLSEIGAYHDASKAGGIVRDELKERVEDFATQLRAGNTGKDGGHE